MFGCGCSAPAMVTKGRKEATRPRRSGLSNTTTEKDSGVEDQGDVEKAEALAKRCVLLLVALGSTGLAGQTGLRHLLRLLAHAVLLLSVAFALPPRCPPSATTSNEGGEGLRGNTGTVGDRRWNGRSDSYRHCSYCGVRCSQLHSQREFNSVLVESYRIVSFC